MNRFDFLGKLYVQQHKASYILQELYYAESLIFSIILVSVFSRLKVI